MFPTLSDYNRTIQKFGASAFRTLNSISFIPSRVTPIKIFSFGSGSFAVVFKALENSKEIAIRCFIGNTGDYVNRYKRIDNYLKNISQSWKSNIEFIDNEIQVNGNLYPVLKMEWADGLLLDKYVSKNLFHNDKLIKLQIELVNISDSLESNKISHGDIQEGNIIFNEVNGVPKVKLIDYDGMFIPDFKGEKQIERGRSEYQHPKRETFEFNEKIDRFSFWVILCALESLKFDKTLWDEVMQGGFNTLSNMLFSANDFSNPNQSKLFKRLEILNEKSLNFYITQLKDSLSTDRINKLELYKEITSLDNNSKKTIDNNINDKAFGVQIESELIKISSSPTGASVRNKNYEEIGKTPLQIERRKYLNDEIKIIFSTTSKSIVIYEITNEIHIDFNTFISNPIQNEETEEIKISAIVKAPKKNVSAYVFASIIIILMVFVGLMQYNKKATYVDDTSGGKITDDSSSTDSLNIEKIKVSNYNHLKEEIDFLKTCSLNETTFIKTEESVDSSLRDNSITKSEADSLKAEIYKTFKNRIYNQCEEALNNANGKYPQIKRLLKGLENRIGLNPTINNYKKQIEMCEYYSVTLPNKIDDFVQKGIGEFNYNDYQQYRIEALNMTGLKSKYKENFKFKEISSVLLLKLKNFYEKYDE